jgi:GTP-binding protein
MKIKSATLARSFAAPGEGFVSDDLPEAAFMGRSNVGKSSLINGLLRRKKLARTSQTPGKTRLAHFYLVNDRCYFVDLPGYGYAKVSKAEQDKWKILVEGYLRRPKQPVISLLLLDCRHQPTAADRQLKDWLEHNDLGYLVVLTKSDKLSRSRVQQVAAEIRKGFLERRDVPVIPFSSKDGTGRDELWKELDARFREPADRTKGESPSDETNRLAD